MHDQWMSAILFNNLPAIIRGTIIKDYDFNVAIGLVDNRLYSLGKIGRVIKIRNDNRDKKKLTHLRKLNSTRLLTCNLLLIWNNYQMLKKLYDKFERNFVIGRASLQPLFESLHRISLRGMNYGQIANLNTSGEYWLMTYIKKQLDHAGLIMPTVFDVGANVGDYSNQLLQVFQNANVWAFEPSPSTFIHLKKNLSKQPTVKCVQVGLGEKEDELTLFYDEERSVHASFTPFELHELGRKNLMEVKVPTTSIDQFCERSNIDRIHFLKLDIEGHEIYALKGASRMIKEKRINYIQFEFGVHNIQNGVYLKNMFNALEGYSIARILKDGVRKIKYDYRHEIIITTNYLAYLDNDT